MAMRAMVVTELGPPDVLKLQERPVPAPGEHDLLVEVHAAALNPVDYKVRRGAFRQGRSLPFILGYDAKEEFVQRVMQETAGRGCPVIPDAVGSRTFDRSLDRSEEQTSELQSHSFI